MSPTTLQSLFGYKAWADTELLDALGALPPGRAEQLQACLRTFNHIHVVDRIFRAHLSGEPRPFDATHLKEIPPLEQLAADVKATDIWYQGYVATLAGPALSESLRFTFTDGDAGCMSREEMLLHVIAHGASHRGNIGQVLKSIGVTPPRDLYTKFLHVSEPGRRHA